MKTNHLARIVAGPLLILAWSQCGQRGDSAAPTTCKDGTTSTATGRGACSGHGGVQKAAPAAAPRRAAARKQRSCGHAAARKRAPPTSSSRACDRREARRPSSLKSTTASGNTDPTGAPPSARTALTRSLRHHSGTCSNHGGVAEWLNRRSTEPAAARAARQAEGYRLEQRLQRRPDIVEQLGLAGCVRVDAVSLHERRGRGRCPSAGTAPAAASHRAPDRA